MNRFALLTIAGLAACSSRDRAPAPAAALPVNNDYAQAHVLRTYQVPPGHEKRAERLLREINYPVQVVSEKGTQTQFVSLRPQITGEGFFVLSAPVGIHDGVRDLLDKLKTAPPKSGPTTVETTYWIVLGWPAQKPTISPQLGDAAAALDKLSELGPMRFELLDRVQLAALDGEQAEAQGHAIRSIKSTASLDAATVALRIQINVQGGKQPTAIETSVTVKPGQFAVLGQAGFIPDAPPPGLVPAGQPERATLFYVVRSRTL